MSNQSTSTDLSLVEKTPTERTGSFRFAQDWQILAVMVVVGLIISNVVVDFGFNRTEQLLYLLICFGLLFNLSYQRVYYTWLVIKPGNWYIRRVLGGKLWTYNDRIRRLFRKHVFPLQADFIVLRANRVLGIMHHRRTNVDYIKFVADSWTLAARNVDNQVLLHRALGDVMKQVAAAVPGYGVGYGFGFAKLPLDRYDVARTQAVATHQAAKRWWSRFSSEQVPMEGVDLVKRSKKELRWQRLGRNLAQLQPVIDDNCRDHEGYVVIGIYRDNLLSQEARKQDKLYSVKGSARGGEQQANRPSRWWWRRKQNALTERTAHRLNIVQIAMLAEGKFKDLGIVNPRFVDRQGIERHIRNWDVVNRPAYLAGQLDYQQTDVPEEREAADAGGQADTPANKVEVYHPHEHILVRREPVNNNLQAVFDGTYCAAYLLTSREPYAKPWHYRLLWNLPANYYAFMMLGTMLRADKQVRFIEATGLFLGDVRQTLMGNDQPSRVAQTNEADREDKADRYHQAGFILPQNDVLVVMERSSQQLETDGLNVETVLNGGGYGPVRVDDEFLFSDIVLEGVTGAVFL